MKDDPTISRIREERHRISERCGHDPKRLVEYYMKLQEQHHDRFVTAEKSEFKIALCQTQVNIKSNNSE